MRRLAAFDGTMSVSSPTGGPDDRHPGGPVRLVLAEDHALLRDGLIRLLEAHGFTIVARGRQRRRPRAGAADPDADAAVVDVRLPPTFTDEGLRAAIAARAARPGFPVMVLSQYVEQLYARELLASGEGAVGYLLKDRVSDVARVRRRRTPGRRRRHRARPRGGRRPSWPGSATSPSTGSPRASARCSALMAEGRSNAAIAAALFVTEKAVAKHINSIFTKLDLPLAIDDNRRVLAVLAWLNV